MTTTSADVDVVLPCLDEAEALPWVLGRIPPGWRAIVVDNGSRDAATLAYLAGLAAEGRIRLLRDDGPFNFSALNNRAARAARGAAAGSSRRRGAAGRQHTDGCHAQPHGSAAHQQVTPAEAGGVLGVGLLGRGHARLRG